ncbi:MAG: hypothetical protein NW206_06995 [Hyphomonadaceae bacterium]|nr:hypothetical protein [Hyphomonadaceae bacterium]
MHGQSRVIRRPAVLGLVAATALAVAMATSWSLAARAEALRPGWGAKAVLIPFKGSDESELASTADF